MKVLLIVFMLVPFVLGETNMPIIGILAMESNSVNQYLPGENYTSYIAAQYVKFVEAAGARAVPVWIGQNREYYENIVNNTNGLLLPGGATWFTGTNGYAAAGKILYDIAVDVNDRQHYYPIFGICLGMELLAHISNEGRELRQDCQNKKVAQPLGFTEDFASSKLFGNVPDVELNIMKNQNVIYYYHQFCITEGDLELFELTSVWKVASTSNDTKGLKFVSTIEHTKYPFYGVQFHPEKIVFVHKRIDLNIPHSMDAIKASLYFANFFIGEARKNDHKYDSWFEEQDALIYNYNSRLVKMKGESSDQLYMFK